jgi:VWFA-related protein
VTVPGSRLPASRHAARAAIITVAAFIVSAGAHTLPASQTGTQRPATPPPVSYAVDVSLVEVDAVVTDGEGKVIRDLRRDEFHVFEDGRAQTLDRLSLIEIPIQRADARAPLTARTLDVQSNQQRFDGRLYVLLLDDLHTSALRGDRVKAAAREFIEQRLGPSDLVAVVHVSATRESQDFTTDRTRLLASVDRFAGRMLRSETLNRIDEYNRQLLSTGRIPDQVRDLDEPSRGQDSRRVFDVIAGISQRVAPVRGRRKALLWFGEGVAYDMFDIGGRQQASDVLESSRAAVAAASRANVAIYGVDARGLRGLGEETMQLTSPAEDPTRSLGASALNEEVFRSQQNLRRVSDETGGFAVVNAGDFSHAFERVVEENSEYYLLGYYSTNPNRDGAFRRVEVRVDRPDARVRARSGYVASGTKSESTRAGTDAEMPPGLRDALIGAVPVSGLPLAAHTAAFKGPGDKTSLLVTVEYGSPAFDNLASDSSRLVASAIAVEPGGKVAASDQSTIALNVRPETRQAMRAGGFRTHSRLELAPGRYQIRVAALLGDTGLVGSVHEDVDVPDLSAPPFAMSGVVMTSVDAGLIPTAHLDDRMREVLPAPPTTSRAFRHDGAIALFAEVYEHGSAPKHDVTMATRVHDNGGRVVFERDDVRTANELKKSKGGYSLQISLRQFPPGDYVLQLQAESREAGSKPAAREIAFRVGDPSSSTSTAGETPRAPAESIESLPIVAVAKGAVSGVPERREVIARNATEWSALWDPVSHGLAAPVVAFENTMIVGVFLGARPTAGYEPEIVRVVREGESLVVEWREREPRDTGNPPNETTPFVLAGVPQHAGEVRFRRVAGAP